MMRIGPTGEAAVMLLPITLTFAAAAATGNVVLAGRIVPIRLQDKVLLGDGGQPLLLARTRAHANLPESAPSVLMRTGHHGRRIRREPDRACDRDGSPDVEPEARGWRHADLGSVAHAGDMGAGAGVEPPFAGSHPDADQSGADRLG
jgi:hypothetical protein